MGSLSHAGRTRRGRCPGSLCALAGALAGEEQTAAATIVSVTKGKGQKSGKGLGSFFASFGPAKKSPQETPEKSTRAEQSKRSKWLSCARAVAALCWRLLGRPKEKAVLPGAGGACSAQQKAVLCPFMSAKLGDEGEGALLYTHVCQERSCTEGSGVGSTPKVASTPFTN